MRLVMLPCSDSLHLEAHAAGAARDGAHRCIQIGRRQVGHLGLGDVLELLARDLADLFGVRALVPDSMPTAFFSSTDAGGVLVMKVKLRSE